MIVNMSLVISAKYDGGILFAYDLLWCTGDGQSGRCHKVYPIAKGRAAVGLTGNYTRTKPNAASLLYGHAKKAEQAISRCRDDTFSVLELCRFNEPIHSYVFGYDDEESGFTIAYSSPLLDARGTPTRLLTHDFHIMGDLQCRVFDYFLSGYRIGIDRQSLLSHLGRTLDLAITNNPNLDGLGMAELDKNGFRYLGFYKTFPEELRMHPVKRFLHSMI